jgi:hypothetical protein
MLYSPFLRRKIEEPKGLVLGGFLCGDKCKAQADAYRAQADATRMQAESAKNLANADIKLQESERLRLEQLVEFEKLMQGQTLELQKLTAGAQSESLSNADESSDKNRNMLAGIALVILIVTLVIIKRK